MVGGIWFVRVVHYPLFAGVGRSGFAAHSGAHTRLTGLVVGQPMLLESATGVALPVRTPPGISVSLVRAGLVIRAGIRLSTVLLQSPRHIILGEASTPSPHRSLVTSDRLRTVPWSLCGLIVFWILYEAMD